MTDGERSLRAMLGALDEVVFLLDERGRHLESHGRLLEALGAGPPLGKTLAELFGADGEAAHERARQCALSGAPTSYDWVAATPRGPRLLQTSLAPVADAPGQVAGVTRDLSDHCVAQASFMIEEQVGHTADLVGALAHEINNPLASVMANLDVVLQLQARRGAAAMPDTLIESLADAHEAAERIRRIIRDLRILGRAEREAVQPVDVEEAIDGALRVAFHQIGLRCRVEKRFTRPPRVAATPTRLARLFLDLVLHSTSGREDAPALSIATRCDDSRVLVEITDGGPTLSDDVRRRAFTPFFMTCPASGRNPIGLALCNDIATSFGGAIEVHPVPGVGNRFVVALPVAGPPNLNTGQV